jgi:hypothetical protein
MLPKARVKDLVVENLDDETLVYDLLNNRAHCLNSTASMVWRYCDGRTDVNGIARKILEKTKRETPSDVVQLALQNLHKAQLLDEDGLAGRDTTKVSRRELIKTIGKTATIALPLVTSIVAPEAAQAASCIPTTSCPPGPSSRPQAFKNHCCCHPPTTPKTTHLWCQPTGCTAGPPTAPPSC